MTEFGRLRRRIFWLALLFICFAGVRGEAVVLRYDLKEGDVTRSREMTASAVRSSFNVMGQIGARSSQQVQSAVYRETVREVTPEGVIVLVRTLESGEIIERAEGQEETSKPLPKKETVIRMTPRGRILSARTSYLEGEDDGQQSGKAAAVGLEGMGLDLAALEAVFSYLPLPEEDVQPNDTWNDEVRLPGFLGEPTTTITFKSRLIALKRYRGRDCAKIHTTFEMPLDLDISRLLGAPLPPGVEAKFTFDGKIAGSIEWQFDYRQSKVVYAEGPVQMTVKSAFSFTGPKGQSASGGMNLAMKANAKTRLIEDE
jgi:hypothetical protein